MTASYGRGPLTPESGAKGVKCGLYLTDAVYYWRARVVRAENKGVWSNPFQFHLNTMPRAPVTEDDTLPLDVMFPDDWAMDTPEVIAVFPENNQAAVPVNTQLIAVVIQGIIPADKIDFDSLFITCEPNIDFTDAQKDTRLTNRTGFDNVMGDQHGGSLCDIDVIYNTSDNTTTLILKLKPFPGSEQLDYEHIMPAVYRLAPYDYKRLKPALANIAYVDYESVPVSGGVTVNSSDYISDPLSGGIAVTGLDYDNTLPAEASVPGSLYTAPLLASEAKVI